MSRRETRVERVVDYPPPPPSKCAKVLYYTWKLCSLVFSHFVMISLVVAYCILGAVTFEKLEAQHEREVKMNISQIRGNTTQSIWHMTRTVPLLNQTNWTSDVVDMLKDFENAILLEMKVRGWDGNESTEHIQWTFTGALFYSIIVITTIEVGMCRKKLLYDWAIHTILGSSRRACFHETAVAVDSFISVVNSTCLAKASNSAFILPTTSALKSMKSITF
ncbi:unnamed protein product, partial [Iphiclides podalirius]